MLHKINVSISYQPEGSPFLFFNVGDTADLSVLPAEDIARLEKEWRSDIQKYVIERVEAMPPTEEN